MKDEREGESLNFFDFQSIASNLSSCDDISKFPSITHSQNAIKNFKILQLTFPHADFVPSKSRVESNLVGKKS